MKFGDITCRKCGRDASQIKGWLQRVNPKGEPMVAECRPACYPLITNEQAVIGAISGDDTLAEAEQPVAWRTEAAAWLRRQADDAESDSERTGWANPAHHMPATLRRIAEKLDAEQEAAPFGIECPPSPRREPLTEEEVESLIDAQWSPDLSLNDMFRGVASAIERAHGIG